MGQAETGELVMLTAPSSQVPFLSISVGVKLHDWELFGEPLPNVPAPSTFPLEQRASGST